MRWSTRPATKRVSRDCGLIHGRLTSARPRGQSHCGRAGGSRAMRWSTRPATKRVSRDCGLIHGRLTSARPRGQSHCGRAGGSRAMRWSTRPATKPVSRDCGLIYGRLTSARPRGQSRCGRAGDQRERARLSCAWAGSQHDTSDCDPRPRHHPRPCFVGVAGKPLEAPSAPIHDLLTGTRDIQGPCFRPQRLKR